MDSSLPSTMAHFTDGGDRTTTTISPKRDISARWREFHGEGDWMAVDGDGLLSPLHPCLRREIIKYGELAVATYEGFDFDPLSEYCGSCKFNYNKFLQELGLENKHGYKATRHIYALSHVDVPDWVSRIFPMWDKDSNWMGYVAVSNDQESKRIGRRDIVVAWRGTVAPTEWFINLKVKLFRVNDVKKVKVQKGFHSIYTSKDESKKYNKCSASEQVMDELVWLVERYRNKNKEEISITITGHSLGGALALLTADEAATRFPGVFISVISFGAPRVGNLAFREQLTKKLGVKVLRVIVDQDIVPELPGPIVDIIVKEVWPGMRTKWKKLTNEVVGVVAGQDIVADLRGVIIKTIMCPGKRMNWIYKHVGKKLKLDIKASPYLKKDFNIVRSHNMEVYLHLVAGFVSSKSKFQENGRDLALVNKGTNRLIDELKIPEFWYDRPYKGLVLDELGRWVKLKRVDEDVPTPSSNHEPVLDD